MCHSAVEEAQLMIRGQYEARVKYSIVDDTISLEVLGRSAAGNMVG
jgi:hypothetical protein